MTSPDNYDDKAQLRQYIEIAKAAAIRAGAEVMSVYRSAQKVENKRTSVNPLTVADLAANDLITGILSETGIPIITEESPMIPYGERKNQEQLWLVDPLDGTKEFLNRNDEFTINIALVKRGYPVAGVVHVPVTSSLYYGARDLGYGKMVDGVDTSFIVGQSVTMDDLLMRDHITIALSRSHPSTATINFLKQFNSYRVIQKGSAIKFMLLLEGLADLYPRFGPTMEWDTAAAHAILNSANKGVYQLDLFTELAYNKPELVNPPFLAF